MSYCWFIYLSLGFAVAGVCLCKARFRSKILNLKGQCHSDSAMPMTPWSQHVSFSNIKIAKKYLQNLKPLHKN